MATSTIESGLTNYDGLLAGGEIITDDNATLTSGSSVVRGQALGQVTSGGKWKTFDSNNSDGTQLTPAVALETVDASAGDKPIAIMLSGEVNGLLMTFTGSGDTYLTLKPLFRKFAIYIKRNQRYVAN